MEKVRAERLFSEVDRAGSGSVGLAELEWALLWNRSTRSASSAHDDSDSASSFDLSASNCSASIDKGPSTGNSRMEVLDSLGKELRGLQRDQEASNTQRHEMLETLQGALPADEEAVLMAELDDARKATEVEEARVSVAREELHILQTDDAAKIMQEEKELARLQDELSDQTIVDPATKEATAILNAISDSRAEAEELSLERARIVTETSQIEQRISLLQQKLTHLQGDERLMRREEQRAQHARRQLRDLREEKDRIEKETRLCLRDLRREQQNTAKGAEDLIKIKDLQTEIFSSKEQHMKELEKWEREREETRKWMEAGIIDEISEAVSAGASPLPAFDVHNIGPLPHERFGLDRGQVKGLHQTIEIVKQRKQNLGSLREELASEQECFKALTSRLEDEQEICRQLQQRVSGNLGNLTSMEEADERRRKELQSKFFDEEQCAARMREDLQKWRSNSRDTLSEASIRLDEARAELVIEQRVAEQAEKKLEETTQELEWFAGNVAGRQVERHNLHCTRKDDRIFQLQQQVVRAEKATAAADQEAIRNRESELAVGAELETSEAALSALKERFAVASNHYHSSVSSLRHKEKARDESVSMELRLRDEIESLRTVVAEAGRRAGELAEVRLHGEVDEVRYEIAVEARWLDEELSSMNLSTLMQRGPAKLPASDALLQKLMVNDSSASQSASSSLKVGPRPVSDSVSDFNGAVAMHPPELALSAASLVSDGPAVPKRNSSLTAVGERSQLKVLIESLCAKRTTLEEKHATLEHLLQRQSHLMATPIPESGPGSQDSRVLPLSAAELKHQLQATEAELGELRTQIELLEAQEAVQI